MKFHGNTPADAAAKTTGTPICNTASATEPGIDSYRNSHPRGKVRKMVPRQWE
jgi:hypothetical protein